MNDKTHWNAIYDRKDDSQLSWHQDDASTSLALMQAAGLAVDSSVIDIGAGTSRLVDSLIARGQTQLTVLDLSEVALSKARARLGPEGAKVDWIAADVTNWQPSRTYDFWHDRAVFHFLVAPADQAAYLQRLSEALRPGGHAIIATFAHDGPNMCSGLPVARYSPVGLANQLCDGFSLEQHRLQTHQTPWGTPQSFQYSLFRKR